MTQNSYIELIRSSSGPIIDTLAKRKWSLITAKKNEDFFICSDNPASVKCKNLSKNSYPPGLGSSNTVLSLPLNKNFALVAECENNFPDIIKSDRKITAFVNDCTLCYAKRFVYSITNNFSTLDNKSEINSILDISPKFKKN